MTDRGPCVLEYQEFISRLKGPLEPKSFRSFGGDLVFMNYGRYQVIKKLGWGAMGVVYLAHDPQIGRDVALKVLRQDRVTDGTLIERFRREAKAIGLLSHTNIVMVYDVGEDHGTIFIVVEFVEGTPLNNLIKEKKLAQEEAVELAIQVAEALDYAHQKGIVHRDIKPSNIIVQPDGQVKITDFGIAHLEDPTLTKHTQTGEVLGTPVYMSPEQALGDEVDRRTDLFSLGIILYEIVTGSRPFSGKSLASVLTAIIKNKPPEPNTLNPEIPVEFSQIISKCLNKSADKRYQTGKELAEALTDLSRKEPEIAILPTEFKPKKKRLSLLLVIIFVVIVVGGTLLWVIFSELPIMLRSEPSGAEVYVNGNLEGVTPLLLKHTEGPPHFRVAMKDYHTWDKQISILQFVSMKLLTIVGRIEPLHVTLKQILAILPVQSEPPGARVEVNGDFKGETGEVPLRINLRLGTYTVKVTKEGYFPWEKEISLEEEKEFPLVFISFSKLTILKIESTPAGADVYVGKEISPRDKTPCSLRLVAGAHTIRVAKKGYRTWQKEISLKDDSIERVSLELILVILPIKSIPSGAKVYVDGKYKGKTTNKPLNLALSIGAHRIRLVSATPGYHVWEDVVQISDVNYPLRTIKISPKEFALLDIISIPPGADIYINGKKQGETPISNLNLKFGKYEILGKMSGYDSQKKTLTLNQPKPSPVKFNFLKPDAFLLVKSKPSDAEVSLDNKFQGRSPITIQVTRTTHQLRFAHPDYQKREISVDLSDLKKNGTYKIVINLETGFFWGQDLDP